MANPMAPRVVVVNGNPVINNLLQAQTFAANLNSYETITQSLYDSQVYPAAGINTLTYFQAAQGAGVGVISGVAKTLEDTNMQVGGSLPAMQGFIVTSIEIDFQPGVKAPPFGTPPAVFGAGAVAAQVNDAWIFRATGYLIFLIGQKPYLQEGPLMKFPASNDYEIYAAMSDASTAAASQQSRIAYGKAVGPAYILTPNNLLLIPTQNFSVTLNWATVEAISVPGRAFVRLMGQLLRAAQ